MHFLMSGQFTLKKADNRINKGSASSRPVSGFLTRILAAVHVLFTLKFDDAGNWKIVKTHRMSKKEVEDEQ